MNAWPYVRGALVGVFFLGGLFGQSRPIDFPYAWPYIAGAVFAFGVVGMLFVVGIQAANPRSDLAWTYPRWARNPFTMRQPLQFFHLGGYAFMAAGTGALLRALFVPTTSVDEPLVITFWGAGMLAGVWCCVRVFRRKMELSRA